jgi:hypothetical protein
VSTNCTIDVSKYTPQDDCKEHNDEEQTRVIQTDRLLDSEMGSNHRFIALAGDFAISISIVAGLATIG